MIFSSAPLTANEIVSCSLVPDEPVDTGQWRQITVPAGHADAHIIIAPDSTVTLVDAGSTTTASTIQNILNSLEIQNIEQFILTHPHPDHIEGLPEINSAFLIKKLYRPELDLPTSLSESVKKLIQNQEISKKRIRRGDTLSIFENTTARIIHPPRRLTSRSLNQNSLVFYFKSPSLTSLWMGDVTNPAEKNLLAQKIIPGADIVKIGHHGNAAGTSRKFLNHVQPQVGIITVPKRPEDPWGRPDRQLLDRLISENILTLHTGKTGVIDIHWNQTGIEKIRLGRPNDCF